MREKWSKTIQYFTCAAFLSENSHCAIASFTFMPRICDTPTPGAVGRAESERGEETIREAQGQRENSCASERLPPSNTSKRDGKCQIWGRWMDTGSGRGCCPHISAWERKGRGRTSLATRLSFHGLDLEGQEKREKKEREKEGVNRDVDGEYAAAIPCSRA